MNILCIFHISVSGYGTVVVFQRSFVIYFVLQINLSDMETNHKHYSIKTNNFATNLLYTPAININGYVPIFINTLDTIIRGGGNMLTK